MRVPRIVFGEIINNENTVGAGGCRPDTKIKLNEYGSIIDEELKNTKNIRKEIKLDKYIIMPNHLHGIIIIERNLSGRQPAAPTGNIDRKRTLSSFVFGFKSIEFGEFGGHTT